jgi:DNA-binding beta-propeller fold protein YncE
MRHVRGSTAVTVAAVTVAAAFVLWTPCASAQVYAGERAPGWIVGYDGAAGTVVNPDTPIPDVRGLTIDEFGRLLIATNGGQGEVLLFDIDTQTLQTIENDENHYVTEDVYPDPADSNVYVIKNGSVFDGDARCHSYLGILEGGIGPAGVLYTFGVLDRLVDLQVWPMGERAGNILVLSNGWWFGPSFLAEFEKTGPGSFTRLADVVGPDAISNEPTGFAVTPGGDIVVLDRDHGLYLVVDGGLIPFGEATGPGLEDIEIGSDGTIYVVNTESGAIERYDEYGARMLPDLTGGISEPTAVTAASFAPTPEGPYAFVEPIDGVEITFEEVTSSGFTTAVAESSENRVSPAGNFLPDFAALPGERPDKFLYIRLATEAVYRSLIQVDVLMEGSRLFYASGVGDTFRDFTVVGTIDDARGTMPRFEELGSPVGRRLETGPTEVVLVDDTRPLPAVTLYKFRRLELALDLGPMPSQNSCPWQVLGLLEELRQRARRDYDEGDLLGALSELAVINSILREHAGWCVPDMSDDPELGNLVGKILAHAKTLMYSIEQENGEAFTGVAGEPPSMSLAVANSPGRACSLALSGPVGAEVALRIYDLSGRLVATVFDGRLPNGGVSVVWDGVGADGTRAASGVYFAMAELEGATRTAKVVLIR